ncbi:MAG: hypothetical protein ACI85O_000946 [Saprospiraceae bacterium]|jgi:hypothetical protein
MKSIYIYILLLTTILFASCNLEKEIELELPEYERQTVIECYLEPGLPFSLLLTKSDGFFSSFGDLDESFLTNLLEEGAEVSIKYGTETVTLANEFSFNFFTGKLFNYSSSEIVPEDFASEFSLEIKTASGEIITSQTKIMPQTPIDSLLIQFEPFTDVDTAARVLTYTTDDLDVANFYRFILATGADAIVEQDFVVDDELLESEISVFGTNYSFNPGDTITSTFIQISEDYYRFKNSVDNSVASNGNPFGQPGVISSNVEGEGNPLGIFTGFIRDVKVEIVPE